MSLSLTAALADIDKKVLNGAGGRPSPLASVAKTVLLGDRLDELSSLGSTLASVASGNGASLIGVEDGAASLVAADVEAALAELATPPALVAGIEAANAIGVTFTGPAHVAQYVAEVWDADGIQVAAAAYTIAETGTGAEVSNTAQARLIFTTSAAGAAILTVTDVSGVSTATLYLVVKPLGVSLGAKSAPAAAIAITFA